MPFRISDRLDRHAISSLEGSATLKPWHDDKLRLRGRYNGSHTTSPTTQRRLIHIRLKQHIIQQDPRRRSANDRSGSFYQQSRFRPTKPFTSSDVPRGTVPTIYSFVDIWINNYGAEILVPKQEPAVHASAPFPTSLRRRGPDGQQDPPHGHHLHRTTSSVTRTPTDDKRGVTPSQIRFELNTGIDNHTLHKLPPTQLTQSHTGAAKPCPSPHSHQPPATHGLSSHRSQSAQHSAARRDSTHARDVRPPHITPRESHRRSPSSYGRSPAPRRQPGRALRDLR